MEVYLSSGGTSIYLLYSPLIAFDVDLAYYIPKIGLPFKLIKSFDLSVLLFQGNKIRKCKLVIEIWEKAKI